MTSVLRPAVFLDRDGVINAGGNIDTADQMQVLPGVPEAIRDLKDAGFVVVVVTNQGGLGENFKGQVVWHRAPLTRQALFDIHEEMLRQLGPNSAPDLIKFCPHATFLNCSCRKPKPGMLNAAARELKLALGDSYMIGDRDTDLLAGLAAGAHPILVRTGEEPGTEAAWSGKAPLVASLAEAASLILSNVSLRG